ncbi:MAG: WD40 repeat domain-containing protein, partial [Candidatus Sigynarchaeota archaeon]
AFSPDGKWIASGSVDKTVRVWNPALGITCLEFEEFEDWWKKVDCLPKEIVGNNLHMICNIKNSPLLKPGMERYMFLGHFDSVTTVAFSPDGHFLASGSGDGTIRLWNLEQGMQTIKGWIKAHSDGVTSVRFSRDSDTLFSGGHDGFIRAWDTRKGSQVRALELPRFGKVSVPSMVRIVLGVSPDGSTLATGTGDGVVRLYNTRTFELVSEHEEQKREGIYNPITCVRFSHRGKKIASGAEDGSVVISGL